MMVPTSAMRAAMSRAIGDSMVGLLRESRPQREALLRGMGEAIGMAMREVFGHEGGQEAASAFVGGVWRWQQ